jgi:methionyl-tRNA formyltransferase
LPTQVVNHVRSMQPWPGSFSTLLVPGRESLRVSITAVEPTEEPADAAATPGTILPTEGELVVQTGGGPLRVLGLKPAGKREMTGAEFRRGHPLPAGARFSGS